MKILYTRMKPYLGMVIMDVLFAFMFLYSMQWSFEKMEDIRLRLLLISIMIIIFGIAIIIRYRSMHRFYGMDDVTGGMSKKHFELISQNLLDSGESYVMVYANVDQFKLINDMYGSDTGDVILKQIQSIINQELVRNEVSGRIMADNFGILMRYLTMEKLADRLQRISRRVRALQDKDGVSYGIQLTYGICEAEAGDHSFHIMIERANLARANVEKNVYPVAMGIYDESAIKRLSRERELETKMQKALENGEFVPYLQPKYELKNETVAGAEALVRWISADEGIIYPGEFIPLFEKNGFIVQLDLYMFEEVCKLIDRWESAGCNIIPISVNLSRAHFTIPDFFEAYKAILKKYQIPKGSIEFELTESLLYNNFDQVNALVDEIHKLGFLCSIDDFGSGYSSLNMLRDVRVDVLKIDRVFFSEGDNSKRGRDIIRTILGLAQALQLKTVSEGIELQRQVDFLKEMSCDYVQGYIFAKPMTVDSFERVVYLDEAAKN